MSVGTISLVALLILSSCRLVTMTAFPGVEKPSTQAGQVLAPLMSPAGGRIGHGTSVALLSITGGATVRYTLDGSTPTATTGNIYAGPFTLPYGLTTVKAVACRNGMTDSAVSTCTFSEPIFLYSVNQSAVDTIRIHTIDMATGVPHYVASIDPSLAPNPQGACVDPTGSFLYVSNGSDDTISAFRIDPATGNLAPLAGQPFSVGTYMPACLVCMKTASGSFLYATSQTSMGAPYVLGFKIGPTGALSATGQGFISAAGALSSIAANAALPYIYVTIQAMPGWVQTFQVVDPSGTLQNEGTTPTPGDIPFSLAADPLGKYLFAGDPNTMSRFDVAGGTPGVNSSLSVSGNHQSMVVDPTGSDLYVAENSSSGTVLAYKIAPAGLSAVTGSPFAAGIYPCSITVDPSGHFLYVVNSGDSMLSCYSIDAATGELSSLGSQVDLGYSARFVAVAAPQ
ncbi:MAG TPA: beta-propeller fold lactonase family protein [Spirochaetia bacterium]|nr:beta-propeller fold lactonase family protein [Spirochaetia bacterium]